MDALMRIFKCVFAPISDNPILDLRT